MRELEGFEIKGQENKVCLLKKSLYGGLKQSSRQWYKRFDEFMSKVGFKRSNFDSCVYFKFHNTSFVYFLLYVDDILMASEYKHEID